MTDEDLKKVESALKILYKKLKECSENYDETPDILDSIMFTTADMIDFVKLDDDGKPRRKRKK